MKKYPADEDMSKIKQTLNVHLSAYFNESYIESIYSSIGRILEPQPAEEWEGCDPEEQSFVPGDLNKEDFCIEDKI